MIDIEEACRVMHDAYEQAAVEAGWQTNPRSRVPMEEVPEANKETMRAAVAALIVWLGPRMIFGLPWFYFGLAVIAGVLGTARLVRLVVNDTWPPMVAFRDRWQTWTAQTEKRAAWVDLFTCGWCLSPWITLANGTWAVLSNVHWTWWAFNGWMALSYVASWLWFNDDAEWGGDSHG